MSKTRTRWWAGRLFELVALLLIVTALVVQLGRLLAPYVSENREYIETNLSQKLGLPVQIGEIHARWEGLRPELTVSNLVIHSADDREILRVGHAQAQLGLLLSVRDLALRLWHIELGGVHMVLDQAPTGRWQLSGFAPSADDRRAGLDPVNALLFSRYVDIDEVHAHFNFHSGSEQHMAFTQVRLVNEDQFHRLIADVDFPDLSADVAQLVYEGHGDPRDDEHFRADAYLKLANFPLTNAVAFVSEAAAGHVGVQDGLLSAELWLQTRPRQPATVKGRVQFERTNAADDEVPQSASADITGSWSGMDDWYFNLQDLQAAWHDRQNQPVSIGISSAAGSPHWRVQAAQLDLAVVSAELQANPDLSVSLRTILADLGVSGSLTNLQVNIPKAAPKGFVLRGNLQQVSVQEWKGAPGARYVDGYIEASAQQGFVEIDTRVEDADRLFALNFPQVYDQELEFEHAQGIVHWAIRPEQNQVQVYSGALNLQGSLGDANGYFYLDAPLERNSRPIELMLQIGLQNARGAGHRQLVPGFLPQSLRGWLDGAVVDGKVPSGAFLLEGFFGHDTPTPPAIQVALNIEGGQLKFDPGWPALEDFSGLLYIDDQRVHAWVDEGRFVQAGLQPTYVEVADNPQGEGLLLQIHGGLSGPAQAGLSVLTETPLQQLLGSAFDDWQLDGELQAGVQLHIPLQPGQPGSRQQVEAALQNTALTMNNLNLHFQQLQGELRYTDQQGLQAQSLTAQLWGQPLQLNIASAPNQETPVNTRVNFSGMLNFAELAAWSQRPEVLFIEGTAPVSGVVAIGSGSVPVNLQINSELQGASIDLPAPYGKTATEKRTLAADIPIARDRINYRFQYDNNRVAVNLQVKPEQPLSGVIALGSTTQQHRNDGIWLAGTVDSLDVNQWLPVVSRYQAFSDGIKAGAQNSGVTAVASGEPGTAAPRLNLNVQIQQLLWGDVEWQTLHVGGRQQGQGWYLQVTDELLKGSVRWRGDNSPIRLAMDYIHWPAAEDTDSGEEVVRAEDAVKVKGDPLQDFQPHKIPPFDFSVADFTYGGRSLGSWSFRARPEDQALRVTNLRGDVDGVQVSAALAEGADSRFGGATLLWQQQSGGDSSTRFYGKLTGGNLADISAAWGLPPMMDSKSVELDVDFSWAGSPLAFSLLGLQGDMGLKVTDGRFYRTTGQTSNALLRLVGLFNFDSWIRRLQLDFSDVVKGGTPFERIRGKLQFDRGMVYLSDPVEVTNTSSVLKMGGKINLRDETLDTSLVATLPVGGNATLIAALAGGLPAAAGVYLVSKIFKKQVDRMASVSYSIHGPWSNPDIQFDKLFDNKAAEEATQDSREPAPEAGSR